MSQTFNKQPNIINALKNNGYQVNTRPYELNIIGVRTGSSITNKFDDFIYACYNIGGDNWVQHRFNATTDPGLHFINQPMNSAGTAILKHGQYIHSHQLGIHRGKYKALVQRKALTVYRSNGKKNNYENSKTQSGLFGINIHHASGNGTSADVDRWSAGCQVIANINNFKTLMGLAEKHQQLYGNHFTYTLLDYKTQGLLLDEIAPNTPSTITKNSIENTNNQTTQILQSPKKQHAGIILLSLTALMGLSTGIYYYQTKKKKKK